MRKVAVTMEDMTERFEAWCEPTPGTPTLSLAERMQRWIGKSEPSTTALTIRNEQPMHSSRWELVGRGSYLQAPGSSRSRSASLDGPGA